MIPKFRTFHLDENAIYYFSSFEEIVSWQHGDGYRIENQEDCQVIYMQSTGLHDKNGVEIFIGDIIEFQDDDESEILSDYDCNNSIFLNRATVTFDNYELTLSRYKEPNGGVEYAINERIMNIDELLEESIVVGNIYENKNLLGVKE